MDNRSNDDRRMSVRRRVQLPFRFSAIEGDASTETLCDVLGMPRAVALRARLSDLDDEFTRVIVGVGDARAGEALRLLDRRIAVLEEILLADLPVPAPAELELSADGIGFAAPAALAIDSWIALHLVLPVNYHVVAAARVSRCTAPREPGDSHWIGAEFQGLDGPTARRLTRFTISRERPTD